MGNEKNEHGVYSYCQKSTLYSIRSRQCFVTGELCSKQSTVHKERERLHNAREINAFVIMNFSDMSDVVYKWKLRSFIESLKKFLFLNNTTHEIACVAESKEDLPNPAGWVPVEKVNVVRADSHTASNYIICNRVCQQMQIADLVIVDVSVENTNVFYEFGMAAAFRKLILPICYNESFYQMKVPEKAKEYMAGKANRGLDQKYRNFNGQKKQSLKEVPGLPRISTQTNQLREMIEHHIDCYPWRRNLFEYYGIRYRNGKSGVGYTDFDDIVDPCLGFSDIQYNRFPYDERISKDGKPGSETKKVGEILYGRLANSYNETIKTIEETDQKSPFNTVVIYTMDNIINEEQAGQCVINFYRNMTAQIRREYCFCGDRVGIMGQANIIPDDPKDTKTGQKLLYRVSDVIRIGMNEATHQAQKQRIKTDDYMLGQRDELTREQEAALKYPKEWRSEAIRFTKEHVRNRCIPIYPDEPIYVQQLCDGIQKGILSDKTLKEKMNKNDFDYEHFFCLFHVTLHTLRYTNEIVVDLSRNSLQALFWLGVAHGCNAQAITVRHAPTADELQRSEESVPGKERNIFDVAGLWTAILRSNDTDGFYRQLAMTQIGIEQHNKLTLPEAEMELYQEQMLDEFYEPSPYRKYGYEKLHERLENLKNKEHPSKEDQDELMALCKDMHSLLGDLYGNHRMNAIWKTLSDRNRKESERLESYYRSLFWRRLLRYNELQLYTTQHTGDTSGEPRRVSITWDVDAMAELSHYLSKRTTIGRYRLHALQEHSHDKKSKKLNFISIGGDAMPMQTDAGAGIPLVTHIHNAIGEPDAEHDRNMIRHLGYWEQHCENVPMDNLPADTENRKIALKVHSYRGFISSSGEKSVFTRFLKARCTGNMVTKKGQEKCKSCAVFQALPAEKKKAVDLHLEQVTVDNNWETTGKGNFTPKNASSNSCNLHKTADCNYHQFAQMILWREVPHTMGPYGHSQDDVKYWVSLIGVSGPATLALTSLLVDDDQKRDIFEQNQKKKQSLGATGMQNTAEQAPSEKLKEKTEKLVSLPLNDLQTQIRRAMREYYNERLLDKLKSEAQEQLYHKLSDATGMYLSTMMYQYFFPFLSRADEKRILNGMEACLAAKGFRDMFKEDWEYSKIEQLVMDVLSEVISGLRGVEALYDVEVHYGQNNKDDRWPIAIHPLQAGEKNEAMVSCLFAKKVEKPETKKQ